MSHSTTIRVTSASGQVLSAEFISEAYTLEISLCREDGKRIKHVRIPLNDFNTIDLQMFSAFIANSLAAIDLQEFEDFDLEEIDEDDEDALDV